MSLYKYFKRVDISTSLPDPKGPLSDHVLTASIAEANKEVLKAVAEAKEPQKKGPYIKVTPEYKAKVAKFASINAYITATVQHFSNKTGPNILVNVVSSDHRVYCKGFNFRCHYTCRTR